MKPNLDERRYLKIVEAMCYRKHDTVTKHFMRTAMATIYAWPKSKTKAVSDSLIAKERLFLHPRQRVGRIPRKVKGPEPQRHGVCVYCKRSTKNATIDHIVPQASGGTDDPCNLVVSCYACNQAKGNRTPAQWAKDVLEFNKPMKRPHRIPLGLRLRAAALLLITFLLNRGAA